MHRVVSLGDIAFLLGMTLFISQVMRTGAIRLPGRAAAPGVNPRL